MIKQIGLTLIITLTLINAQAQSDNLILDIKQIVLPYGGIDRYLITDSTIVITRANFDENKFLISDTIYLNNLQNKDITDHIDKADYINLDTSYSIPMIDGTYWQFVFKTKTIRLDNCYIDKLKALLIKINSIIPDEKNRIINFDDVTMIKD